MSSRLKKKPLKYETKSSTNINKLFVKIWCKKCNFSESLTNKFMETFPTLADIKTGDKNKVETMLNELQMTKDQHKPILKEINKLKKEKASMIDFSVMRDKRKSKKKKSKKLGFSVGGENDVNTFRNNIDSGMLPYIKSISYEGIFYDYYFDTETNAKGIDDENPDNLDEKNDELRDNNLFYPTYCYAKKNDNYYLSVGMNSNIDEDQFERNKLNCVIVLDVSGSMGSSFNNKSNKSKMQVACESLICLISQLNYDDKFGLVLFSSAAKCIVPLTKLSEMSMNDIQGLMNIRQGGGTNFDAGYSTGINCFKKGFKRYKKETNNNENEYDNRMIYLTDAIPTVGIGTSKDLLEMVKTNAVKKQIHSTFIGVGLDFNVELINEITKVFGANYYSVKSNKEFLKRMNEEFKYMVSPLVFGLKLNIECEGKSDIIEEVYGIDSDYNKNKNTELMNVNTLFPSPTDDDGDTKGGVIIVKLKKMDEYNISISCKYKDKKGKEFNNKQSVAFKDANENNADNNDDGKQNNDNNEDNGNINSNYFDNNGIRKALLLVDYVSLMKQWIKSENDNNNISKLKVNNNFKKKFKEFSKYLSNEMNIVNDISLKQEIMILDKLST